MDDTLEIDIMCMCGQPASAPVHQGGGHRYQPAQEAQRIRDNQSRNDGARDGHYTIQEQRVYQIVRPAAGVDFTVKVPTNTVWEVVASSFTLVASPAAGNRVPHIVIADALGNVVYNVPAVNNQIANQTKIYSTGASIGPTDFDNAAVLVLPYGLKMLENWTFSSLTTALLAGDQWTGGAILVREWLEF